MNDKKLTPWFSWHVKPARVGVYQAEWGCGTFYNYWDGHQWNWGTREPRDAKGRNPVSIYESTQLRRWRGLASNPMSAGRTKETP